MRGFWANFGLRMRCEYMCSSWIDASTLHKELKVGKDFTTWIKGRISKYEFIENEDYKFCSPKRGSKGRGGHNITDYSLTLDMQRSCPWWRVCFAL